MGRMMDALRKAQAIKQGKVPASAPEITGPVEEETPEGQVPAQEKPATPVTQEPEAVPQARATTEWKLDLQKEIPASKSVQVPADKRAYVVTALEHEGPVAEEFRELKQTVLSGPGAQKRHVVLVTGPGTGEGKSTVAVNLALALAEKADFRVLVVDGDLARPSLHKIFGLEGDRPGLAEMLLGRASVDEATVPTGMANLWLLGSGKTHEKPDQLLSPTKVKEVMRELAHRFRYVIIDGPGPVQTRAGAELAHGADAVLLVIRRSQSDKQQTREAVRLIRNRGREVLGCVLVDA